MERNWDDIEVHSSTVLTVGFIVNPIAGMGGRVGLKGTDDVVNRARALGAVASAHLKARETLHALKTLLKSSSGAVAIRWVTCSPPMGEDVLREEGFEDILVVYRPTEDTTRTDTSNAARAFMAHSVDLILFCGGDGTARDICMIVGKTIPVLGIPSGVKMYSGVFGVSPVSVAEIVTAFAQGSISTAEVEILDLDEELYRRNEWEVRLYQTAVTPFEPTLVQSAKMLITETGDDDARADIASYLADIIAAKPETLFLLGPGSTVKAVADAIGLEKALLGIDAWLAGKVAGSDLNENDILTLLKHHPRCKLVLSPIGAQGFILGRGNLQLSPQIVRIIGRENIFILATPAKLARTSILRVDTGDRTLDAEIVGDGHLPVIVGDRRRRMVRLVA